MKMMIISFSWTSDAFKANRKTKTRRQWVDGYAKRFEVGDICKAYNKQPRFGGKQIGLIKLTKSPYQQQIRDMPDSDFEAEFLEDSSPMGEIHKQEPKDSAGTFGTTGTSQRHVAHKVFFTTLTAGVHTFELNYRTDNGGDESSIWDAVVEIWRVS